MMKDRLIVFGFAGLAAVATAGWMRQPFAVPVAVPAGVTSSFQPPAGVPLPAAVQTPAPAAPQAQPVARAVRRSPEALPVQTASTRRMPVAYDDRTTSSRDDRPETIQKQRSQKTSIAIVAGSAAAGAAIGGIAGGGKGAAIGALSGGAGGYVYDRMTKDK